jgi:hypothetical protein
VLEDVFQNVVLDHAGTERLIAARSFGFVNFTGSVAGGRAIERAAAGTFTALGLVVRTIGFARARVKIGLANLVYNMRRFVWLNGKAAEA